MFVKACQLAYRFLRYRPRTEKEIFEYLNRKKKKYFLSDEVITKTISFLKEEGEIDDRQFVDWFVRGRLRLRPKGLFLLRRELYHLGIRKDLINDYFANRQFREEDLALHALQLKSKRWRSMKENVVVKMNDFLRQRGFNGQSIKRAIAAFSFKE